MRLRVLRRASPRRLLDLLARRARVAPRRRALARELRAAAPRRGLVAPRTSTKPGSRRRGRRRRRHAAGALPNRRAAQRAAGARCLRLCRRHVPRHLRASAVGPGAVDVLPARPRGRAPAPRVRRARRRHGGADVYVEHRGPAQCAARARGDGGHHGARKGSRRRRPSRPRGRGRGHARRAPRKRTRRHPGARGCSAGEPCLPRGRARPGAGGDGCVWREEVAGGFIDVPFRTRHAPRLFRSGRAAAAHARLLRGHGLQARLARTGEHVPLERGPRRDRAAPRLSPRCHSSGQRRARG
ncbi:hypothetical protein M885DRAFT_505803 [Pelagophyceae sp. CCMP2097]|nr:hypothetical protein M885DRAFT_505803 [Pelagophyceae sp. CCMP2097]|mmetsp:Transcript_29144/g.100559  ORF Transcript_29144/g.100559 Transcript_29144/m.100559 type:complete len:298 (+) Transcript_29144:351-1244(+)